MFEGKRHRIAAVTDDPRVGITACGRRFVYGSRCPETPEHRIAMPGCPFHVPPTNCCAEAV